MSTKQLTKKQLYKQATIYNIEGRSTMNKEELQESIESHEMFNIKICLRKLYLMRKYGMKWLRNRKQLNKNRIQDFSTNEHTESRIKAQINLLKRVGEFDDRSIPNAIKWHRAIQKGAELDRFHQFDDWQINPIGKPGMQLATFTFFKGKKVVKQLLWNGEKSTLKTPALYDICIDDLLENPKEWGNNPLSVWIVCNLENPKEWGKFVKSNLK